MARSAPLFRSVLSVEISRELAAAQQHNLDLNRPACTNVRVLRMPAAEVCAAILEQRPAVAAPAAAVRKAAAAAAVEPGSVDLRSVTLGTGDAESFDARAHDFRTVLVDPPRGGLDAQTLSFVSKIPQILVGPHPSVYNCPLSRGSGGQALCAELPHTEPATGTSEIFRAPPLEGRSKFCFGAEPSIVSSTLTEAPSKCVCQCVSVRGTVYCAAGRTPRGCHTRRGSGATTNQWSKICAHFRRRIR
eukprot:SAG11_NODE_3176_length_2631_cov_1.661532_1_plen_246_part_00